MDETIGMFNIYGILAKIVGKAKIRATTIKPVQKRIFLTSWTLATIDACAFFLKETNADIIVISVLLTAAKKNLPKVVSAMEAEGIKDKVTLMIGGDAVDEDDAEEIGAMYGESKEEAVVMAKKVMEEKK